MERKAGFLHCVDAMCGKGELPCMRVEIEISQWDDRNVLGKKEKCDTLMEKEEEMDCSWTWSGEAYKVVYLCDERNWLSLAEVNKAVAGPTNRSGTMAAKA